MTRSAEWYFLAGQEKIGPLSEAGLKVLVARGAISGEIAVWREGMSGWAAVSGVECLNAAEAEEIGAADAGDDSAPEAPGDIWFLDGGGAKQGPVSCEDLLVLARGSWITEKTLVWTASLAEWTPAESTDFLRRPDSAPPRRIEPARAAQRLKTSLGGTASVAGKAARKLGTSAAGAGRNVFHGTKKAASKATKTLEKNWPKIQAATVDKAVPLVVQGLEDEELLGAALDRVYDTLPTVVRIMVRRRFFMKFCFNRKDQLLTRIHARSEPDRQGEAPVDPPAAAPAEGEPGGQAVPDSDVDE